MILKNTNKILLIIQRSNGDVLLSLSLIKALFENFNQPQIDILVNDDTVQVAKTMPFINHIYTFSYLKKQAGRYKQEKNLISSIFRTYDLSINLTSSDRSVIYAILASKNSISAVEKNHKKSWWKKYFLSMYYYFDSSRHILLNNLEPLNLLNISHKKIQEPIKISAEAHTKVNSMLNKKGIKKYIIFHPSAQYLYKIYPKHLRNKFLFLLNSLDVPILITGTNNQIDLNIKNALPSLPNIYDFIGETTLQEYIALSKSALAYIGMDTLNMHIAASQSKRIFAIYGPTNLSMWSPWSNSLKTGTTRNSPLQTYGNVTIFQASFPCVSCGNAGCNDNHGRSECLHVIKPEKIFNEVSYWYKNVNI